MYSAGHPAGLVRKARDHAPRYRRPAEVPVRMKKTAQCQAGQSAKNQYRTVFPRNYSNLQIALSARS